MGRQSAEPDHRLGSSPPLTIGVEEELLLVDAERRLIAAVEPVIAALEPAARELFSSEIFAAQIELETGICASAATAAAVALEEARPYAARLGYRRVPERDGEDREGGRWVVWPDLGTAARAPRR